MQSISLWRAELQLFMGTSVQLRHPMPMIRQTLLLLMTELLALMMLVGWRVRGTGSILQAHKRTGRRNHRLWPVFV